MTAPHLSLVALLATVAVTAIHHIFRLGAELMPASVAALLIPIGLAVWFRRTGNRFALWVYGAYVAMVAFWFGFLDGFLDHVLKALGLENMTFLPGSEAGSVATAYALWSAEATSVFYEGTGVLTAIASVPAVYFTATVLIEEWRRRKGVA